jgi:aspartyl-tRNA(Asn)/glutamyl-tRNA(Gln) amidotransferase subunit B
MDLLHTIDKGTINIKQAKTVFEEMYKRSKEIVAQVGVAMHMPEITAYAIVKEKGLLQISDEGEIETIVDDVLMKNPEAIEKFRAGEEKLIGFFVGQVMKTTKGKANPKIINELLRKKLV